MQKKHGYITVLISIFALWLGVIPFLFVKAVPIVCENLSYNTQYSISVKNPGLYLNIIPNAVIKADEITIRDKESTDSFFVKDLRLDVRILPLISGRVHINKIKATDLFVNVNFNEKAELDANFFSQLSSLKIICDNIDITKIKLDICQKDIKSKAKYLAENLYFKKNGRYLQLKVDSQTQIDEIKSDVHIDVSLPKNNDVNKSVINIRVSNFDIAPLTEYLKNYLPKDFVSAMGNINIDVNKQNLFAELKNIKIIMKDDAKSIIFPELLTVKSGLNLTRKTITINNAEILSKHINTVVSGTISNYIDKPKTNFNLNVRINNSKIEDFISLLPAFKTEDIDAYKLKKYKFYGDTLGNIVVKGDIKEPSIIGSMFINNGVLTKPIPNANGATVKLNFRGKYLEYDVTVPAGSGEKVWVKGGVELYNVKYADMRVWSTKNVDLATAEEKVVPIHEILNFVIGPVPIMDIKGKGNIDIIIKGNRKNPHVWGGLNFYNVTTYFNEIPDLILTGADAVLTFDDENAVFNLKKGLINNKNINIDGTCNLAGKFDFDVKTENQYLADLYRAIQTSTMINDVKSMIPPFEKTEGNVNLVLKVYGNIKDIYLTKFNENFFTKGTLTLLGNGFETQGIKIHDAKGTIGFDNTNAQLDIISHIGKSPMILKALVKDKFADASINIPKLNLRDVVPKGDKFQKEIADITVNVNAKYKGKTDVIEYDKVNFDAQIVDVSKYNRLQLSNGKVCLKDGNLQIKDMNGTFEDTNSSFMINLLVNNIAENPVLNGNIKLKDFELFLINMFGEYEIIPQNIRDIIKSIKFEKGKINLDAKLSNNSINASSNIGGIEFIYTPLNMPVRIINGSVYVRKNYLGLNKINLIASDMPVIIDGKINNIFDKRDFDLYINSKPKQDFIDKYINNNQIYPLKIKGDIVYWIKLKGSADNFNLQSEADLSKDSSIYYLGATVGDVENSIILNVDTNVLKQRILKIKEFSYDKIIDSQGKRQTRLNMLKATGGIDILQNDFAFKDLRVKTSHPTDARIFNILFRKPNIKQGQFTSDLKFNGKLSNPRITGIFHIVETNIPFFDTTMKNLSFVFKDKTIELASLGEVLGNDLNFKGVMRNNLVPPYYIENAEVNTKQLDLNQILNRLKTAQVNDSNSFEALAAFDFKNTIIKRLRVKAGEVRLRNIAAENVDANISISDKKVFNIDNFNFNIANGYVNGNYKYNLINENMGLMLKADGINANDIAIALFDLDNQIHGNLKGNIKISCSSSEFKKCMETLNGDMMFDVKDGRMPKLGSLEYLLKAGNLLKGGLTGLSINSVIDILSPLKTGDFSEIYGTMTVKDGISNDIEIATRGKNLSLFMSGSYNFGTENAQMEVLGLLSKKISTMFGPIGNVSINTLFNVVPGVDLSKDSKLLDKINKIPGIEFSSKAFRKFIAEINGNINGDNYVKSFEWIN